MSNAGAVVAAIRMRKERGIVTALRDRGAVSDRTAMAIEIKRGMERNVMRDLLRHGAVKETAAGTFYLDEAAYEAMRSERRRRGIIVAVSIIVVLAIVAVLTVANL